VELRLFNTMGRDIRPFVPLVEGKVGLYACGPTVYNYAHIGNLRSYIFEDILRKALEYAGYNVRHVMNVTDVGHLTGDTDDGEDRITKSARETGKTVWEIAAFYTKAFFRDFGLLRCAPPTIVCKATDHIQEMIDLIKRIEANGFTYSAGGNLFFDISKFPAYGKLALLDKQTLRPGARIAVDEGKRNPADFALWLTRSKFEHQAMLWDSPWGKGYPGWHIECSAMSIKYLGERFDIHCGGVDAVSVHHTNEIAQSEAATGTQWVNYWMHGEFLNINKEKMAKSTGNLVPLQTLIDKGYDPLDYRYFCLGAHYRSPLNYGYEALDAARAGRSGIMERIVFLKSQSPEGSVEPTGKARGYLDAFEAHMADDLDMPKCLADLWTLLRDSTVKPAEKLGAALRMDRVLDLDLGSASADVELDDEARRLVEEREEARRKRDWKRADEIRAILKSRGIDLQDEGKGTKVRIAAGASGATSKTASPISEEDQANNEKPVTSEGNRC
jgi:cysteinyl-tRNA synthetase